jgi:pimeloyl-ACP methyl ester carboxylesterase
MATYVLVPGAWLGGWAWDDVAASLRDRGHDVYALTLSGLDTGDGAGLVDLERHVTDIVEAIEQSDLHDVVLVGHSYGGLPVSGAADRIPDRLALIVYLDGGPALDGIAYLDTLPPPVRDATERAVREEGGRALLPMPNWDELENVNRASAAGIGPDQRAGIRDRAQPQPFGTYTQAIRLSNPARTERPHLLISCTTPLEQVRALIADGHPWFAELAGPQWSFMELPTGHWPMFSAPAELADMLKRACQHPLP